MSEVNDFGGQRQRVGMYFSVSMGKVVRSLGKEEPADMDGVTKRINKLGVTVYENHLDYLRGYITGASLKQPPSDHPEYGSQMEFNITNEAGSKCVLQVPFDSAYGRAFLYASPGIDLEAPVEFEPYQYYSKKKGRDATGMSIIQHGEQLPWAYGTKANPGGVPPLEKVTFKGKETWDNSKQLAFLEGKFLEFCEGFKAQAQAVDHGEPEEQEDMEVSDELDF